MVGGIGTAIGGSVVRRGLRLCSLVVGAGLMAATETGLITRGHLGLEAPHPLLETTDRRAEAAAGEDGRLTWPETAHGDDSPANSVEIAVPSCIVTRLGLSVVCEVEAVGPSPNTTGSAPNMVGAAGVVQAAGPSPSATGSGPDMAGRASSGASSVADTIMLAVACETGQRDQFGDRWSGRCVLQKREC